MYVDVYRAIDKSYLTYENGTFLPEGTYKSMMISAAELVGVRAKCVP